MRFWLCQMLTLCFVLRALIPAGYMPDLEGDAGGVPRLVICTAQGMKEIPAQDDGADPERSHRNHSGPDCAFAGLTPIADLAAPAFQAAAPSLTPPSSSAFAVITPRLPVRRSGPTSGSRAPPFAV